jgi:hypothetical protein
VLREWVERFRALPDFNVQERNYKFEAIKQVAVAKDVILDGRDGWLDPIRRGFRNQNNNITNWQATDTFLKWVAANPDDAKAALTARWAEGEDGPHRVRVFLDLIPTKATAAPGNRLNVAPYFLIAADPKGSVALLGWSLLNCDAVGMKRRRSHTPVQINASAFAGYRFPPDVIALAVRWYLRFGLSYRDLEELLGERGIEVDHVTLYRWCNTSRPCWSTRPGRDGIRSAAAGSSTKPM